MIGFIRSVDLKSHFFRIIRKVKTFLKPSNKKNTPIIYNLSTKTFFHGRKINEGVKRALVSYITGPFTIDEKELMQYPFSNYGIAHTIIKVLNQLGYVVDVIQWTDVSFRVQKKYDLFFGHGGYNFETIAKQLPDQAIKIYWFPSCALPFLNSQEQLRLKNLYKRHKVSLNPVRSLPVENQSDWQLADSVISLGNQYARSTYKTSIPIFSFNNAAYKELQPERICRDFTMARSNFLFFAGIGNVHKGLDLVIEAFNNIDAHLYIATKVENEFYEIYKEELSSHSNIHVQGWVEVRSSRYYELVEKCAYVIMPSCCEGSPGSIIECMHRGLIPVVSKESTIDTDGFGVTLDSCDILHIRQTVMELADLPVNIVKEKSIKTFEKAMQDYSVQSFERNVRDAIQKTIKLSVR